jgi:short subunit dehydrogenase-like uncharacterized protein
VSRVLVIGGYGGFGARLSRRLLAAGHEVLVGGRTFEKAQGFCSERVNARPVIVDRLGDILAVLRDAEPDIVIDAAGPFQQSGYGVPEACIAAGSHYLDLADARDFVVGIKRLHEAAAKAGIAIISGASTVPALSSAVALHLAHGLGRVDKVDMALSAATHSTANPSVAKAVLTYLGKQIALPRGVRRFGWQGLRRRRYDIFGKVPLDRLVAIVDVPDYDLLPGLLPGDPEVEFRAGTDVSLHMLGLWLTSWPVRWSGFRSTDGLAGFLIGLQRLTKIGGGDRSAMDVRLTGVKSDDRVERRWTLIAENFDGPEIPAMAAALLADDLAAGRLAPGARTAAGLLPLERFEQAFAPLAITHETTEVGEDRRWSAHIRRPGELRSA